MVPEKRAYPTQSHQGAAAWWLLVASLGFLAMLATLCAWQLSGAPVQPGDIALSNITAGHAYTIEDEAATRQARQQARQSVMQVFKREHSIDERIMGKLHDQIETVSMLQKQIGLPLPGRLGLTAEEQSYIIACPQPLWQHVKASALRVPPAISAAGTRQILPDAQEIVLPPLEKSIENKLRKNLLASGRHSGAAGKHQERKARQLLESGAIEKSRQAYGSFRPSPPADLLFLAASVSPDAWARMSATLEAATGKVLKLGPLFPDVAQEDWERTTLEFLPDAWDDRIKLTCTKFIACVLEPNVVVDAKATAAKSEAKALAVKPVIRKIEPGQIIVRKGDTVTAEQSKLLAAMGVSRPINWPLILSLTLSLMAACTFFGLFLNTYAPRHLYSPSSIGLLFTISVVTCAVCAFAGRQLGQFVPLPAASLIATVFFGPRIALALTFVLVIFLQVDNLVSANNLIALSTASAIAIGANIKQRHDLMLRGLLIGLMQACGYLCAVIVTAQAGSLAALAQQLLLQVLGGLSSCIVAIGSLPFLEDIFGMVTPFRITELTASDQTLLRKLEENAPGTYQHSLAVANLAEAGARAIAADVSLVRAGSLYHDIGKMVRPRYFIENQLGSTNPHDDMSPEESRDRVLAHVTDGLALAARHGLPRVVQDFIPQHQGTTLMAYFYHKACLRDGAQNVDAGFYRYPGPKPQSKEAAVVMLADVSEAVTHSLSDPSQEEVEASMSTVFKARWEDGQFNESSLTKDELERVKKAFVRVWRTLHHERLKYPSTTTGRMAVAPELPGKKLS